MSIEHTSRAITENKFLMQLYADQKSLSADLKLQETLRKSDPTRVSEYTLSQKKYELSQIESRIKGKDYSSVRAQCEKYFADNTQLFDKNLVIAETRALLAEGYTVNEFPHLAAVFLIDAQGVTKNTQAALATVAPVVVASSAVSPVLAAPVATPSVVPGSVTSPTVAPVPSTGAPVSPNSGKPGEKPNTPKTTPTDSIVFDDEAREKKELRGKELTVIATKANLRDMNGKVVSTLDKGSKVKLTGFERDTVGGTLFYEIESPKSGEKPLWISSKVVDANGAKEYVPTKLGASPQQKSKPAEGDKKPGTDKIPEKASEEGLKKTAKEFNALLAAKEISGRIKEIATGVWQDTKEKDFIILLDKEGNVSYRIKRDSIWLNNTDLSDFEKDLLQNLASTAKANKLPGNIIDPDMGNIPTWAKVALGVVGAVAVGALAKKYGAKLLTKEFVKRTPKEAAEETLMNSQALVQVIGKEAKETATVAAKTGATKAEKSLAKEVAEDLKYAKEAEKEAQAALAKITEGPNPLPKTAPSAPSATPSPLTIGSKLSPTKVPEGVPSNIAEFVKRPINGNDIRATQKAMNTDKNLYPQFIADDGSVWSIRSITGKNVGDTKIEIGPVGKPSAARKVTQDEFVKKVNLNIETYKNTLPIAKEFSTFKAAKEWVKENPKAALAAGGLIIIAGIAWRVTPDGILEQAPNSHFAGARTDDTSSPQASGIRADSNSAGTRSDTPPGTNTAGVRVDTLSQASGIRVDSNTAGTRQ